MSDVVEEEIVEEVDMIADELGTLIAAAAKRLGLDEMELLDRVSTEVKARLL